MLDFLRRRIKSEHAQTQAMLSAYMDGELTAREQQRVEAHLAHCDACVEELRTLRYTKGLLSKAPMPLLPRSFVVRQADLKERPVMARRRGFGLAYAYLKGATAVIAVAFALLVAGDLIAQLSFGTSDVMMPAMAPAERVYEGEQEAPAESTIVVQKAVKETVVVEKAVEEKVKEVVVTKEVKEVEVTKEGEVQKAVTATPIPAVRYASPTASLPPPEGEHQAVESLALPEDAVGGGAPPPTEVAAAEKAADADATFTPTPLPGATPFPTVQPIEPEETIATLGLERGSRLGLSPIRVVEIGLGGLALILLVITLIVRRQQP